MTPQSRLYSRIYHRLMTEYPTVWASDAQLALLVRLLVVAEKFYPEWPTSNSRNGAYRLLLDAGLVIEAPGGHQYTIRGLAAERERRSAPGRHANAVRWDSVRNPTGDPSGLLEREREREREEKRSDPNGSNPTTFMGYRPRSAASADRLPGEAANPRHDGSHAASCLVCHPLPREGVDAP